MQTLIHADIFFFVTTITVIVVGIAIIVALIFVILILRNLYKLSATVKNEADLIADDIDAMRARVHGLSWSIAFSLFRKLFRRSKDY